MDAKERALQEMMKETDGGKKKKPKEVPQTDMFKVGKRLLEEGHAIDLTSMNKPGGPPKPPGKV